MATFEVDTMEMEALAASLHCLNQYFVMETEKPDPHRSRGPGITQLEELYEKINEIKKAFKDLMDQTEAFLREAKITFDESDRQEAARYLGQTGIISSEEIIRQNLAEEQTEGKHGS